MKFFVERFISIKIDNSSDHRNLDLENKSSIFIRFFYGLFYPIFRKTNGLVSDQEYIDLYGSFYRSYIKNIVFFSGLVLYFILMFSKPDVEFFGEQHTFNMLANITVSSDAFFMFFPLVFLGYWFYICYLLLGFRFLSMFIFSKASLGKSAIKIQERSNFFTSYFISGLVMISGIILIILLIYTAVPMPWIFSRYLYGLSIIMLVTCLFLSMYFFVSDWSFIAIVLMGLMGWFVLINGSGIFSYRSVYLFGKIFEKQDFRFLNLSSSNLARSVFKFSNLSFSNLSGTNFSNSSIQKSDLTNITAKNTNFFNTNLNATDLSNSNLSGSNMKNTKVMNTKFKETNLFETNLSGSNFTISQYQQACNALFAIMDETQRGKFISYANYEDSLENRYIHRWRLDSVNFCHINLTDFVFAHSSLLGVNFSNATLRFVAFLNNFSDHSNFSHAQLKEVNFSGAYLNGSRFNFARLNSVNFVNSDLFNVDFSNAQLYYVAFKGSNLENVNFEGANFFRPDFSDARNLDCEALKLATFNIESDYNKWCNTLN